MSWGRTSIAAIAMGLIATPSARGAGAQSFRSSLEYVLLDVSVRQRGKPVTDLTKDDFTVIDAGVPQRLELVSRETVPIDVTFIVDWSGSVNGPVLPSLTRAIDAVSAALGPADRANVVTFNQAIRDHSALPSGEAISRKMGLPSGQTSLIDATTVSLIVAPTPGRRRMAILFTDGVDTSSFSDATSLVEVAKRVETAVFVVTLIEGQPRESRTPHERLFSALADATGGAVATLRANEELAPSFLNAFEEFRTSYVLAYAYEGQLSVGWHPLAVRVNRRGLDVRTRQGYYTGTR